MDGTHSRRQISKQVMPFLAFLAVFSDASADGRRHYRGGSAARERIWPEVGSHGSHLGALPLPLRQSGTLRRPCTGVAPERGAAVSRRCGDPLGPTDGTRVDHLATGGDQRGGASGMITTARA
jgi:hypothetical protein